MMKGLIWIRGGEPIFPLVPLSGDERWSKRERELAFDGTGEESKRTIDKNLEVSVNDTRSADFWATVESRRAGPLFLQTKG
jgi:hypothetical protein